MVEIRRNDYHGIEDAKAKLGEWIQIYNSERLHSAIEYLTPDEVLWERRKNDLPNGEKKCIMRSRFVMPIGNPCQHDGLPY